MGGLAERVRTMDIHITPQIIITAASCAAALVALLGYLFKLHDWVKAQGKQTEDIKALRELHDKDIADIKGEQTVVVYGVLACLKGLKEQGCNGPVTAAIEKIEKHLNKEAHR